MWILNSFTLIGLALGVGVILATPSVKTDTSPNQNSVIDDHLSWWVIFGITPQSNSQAYTQRLKFLRDSKNTYFFRGRAIDGKNPAEIWIPKRMEKEFKRTLNRKGLMLQVINDVRNIVRKLYDGRQTKSHTDYFSKMNKTTKAVACIGPLHFCDKDDDCCSNECYWKDDIRGGASVCEMYVEQEGVPKVEGCIEWLDPCDGHAECCSRQCTWRPETRGGANICR